MRKRIFTSRVTALALFAIVGLVAALAPSIASLNLARAHSVAGAALTGLTVSPGMLTPAFSSTVHYYTVPVADTVTQITIEATPDGDGTVAYAEADGTALPDADGNTPGQQVAIPTAGKRINVEVTHNDAGEVMEETYGVLVIREGPAVQETITLMALYNSAGGAYWTNDTNWGSTPPLDTWFGVTTDADGRVANLRLTNNNLSGTIPASLGTLTNLTTLDLSFNRLSGAIPASLGSLVNLTTLLLRNNQLSGNFPDSLSDLTSLQTLFLGGNTLSGTIPDSLGDLTKLTSLSLVDNQLTGEIPDSLGDLTKLTRLSLADNQLTGEIPDSLGNLASLQFLDLWDNQLTGEIPASLGNLASLQGLDVENNQLTGTIPDLSSLANLLYLELADNALTGTIPPSLGNFANLQVLNLKNNQLTGTIPDLSSLANLVYLDLGVNALTGTIPPSLGNFASLDYLHLGGNPLSGTIPPSLGNLASLQGLNLYNNQLTGTIPDSLGNLASLQELYLGNNQLTGTIPDSLGNLTSLQVLWLSGTQLTGTIPDSLGNLASLQVLWLSGNQLTGEIPNSLGNLTGLQVTRFAGNALTGCVPNRLRRLVTAPNINSLPAQDFIAVDANTDGDTADVGDTPALGLPFCMLGTLAFSDVTLDSPFASGTAAYTASVANTVAATKVTARLAAYTSYTDRLSIMYGTDTYTSRDSVPLAVGPNEITITVTPEDGTPTLTYTVTVTRAPNNTPPAFNEGPITTRSVPRNTPTGSNIGAPVSATDADNDALTYSLGGADAADFDIAASSGQLQTRSLLNGIQRTSYSVFVSVSDGKDDLGEPETDPQIDTSTEVTINITTTSSGNSGGGSGGSSSGGGGGSGRATPTPTPTPTPSPTPTATPTPTGPQFSGQIAAEPSVTATVVPEGTTLGLNGGGDLPGGVYMNFPPAAVALPVHVSVSVSNTAPDDVDAPSGTTLLPLTIDITPETPITLGTLLTIEINPTPEQLEAAGGDLNNLSVGVVTPNGIVVLPAQVLHGRLVVTTDRLAPFVLLAVTDTGPTLTQPPMGDASSMGPLLQWTQPPQTTWFQVQVIPFNEDGPGINLVIGDGALVRAAQYQVLGPNFGSADPNYVMLPGMTYLWRVRTTTVLTNPTEADWSAWAVSSFKTPPASSSTITPVAPPVFGEVSTLTPTLTWANANTAVFYYEVQVSRDYEFGPNAFLYSEYVHGGASTPPNSYVVPEAFPLEAGEIYYWRVRPRIQGDGDPLPWSATYVFLAPG